MIREHLFKGKTIKEGKWIYGDLIHSWHKMNTKPTTMIYNTLGKTEVDPTTVCEYTGLTDKNGTKIFEGDILHIEVAHGRGFVGKAIVFFEEKNCHYKLRATKYVYQECNFKDIEKFEVIGNIFDDK